MPRPTAPRASGSCRWTSGRRRSWPRSPTRPGSGSGAAGQPGTDPGGSRGVDRTWPAAAARRLRSPRSRPTRVTTYRLTVNGAPAEVDVPGMRRLLDVLREDLALTGTKEGCGEGECGACTVLARRRAGRLVPRPGLPGRRRRRPDGGGARGAGLDPPGATPARARPAPGRVPAAGGAQCGICTPGMLMAARAYLDAGGGPDEDAIREAIAGNLCRCTGYTKIIDAIALAAVGTGDARDADRAAASRAPATSRRPTLRCRRAGRAPARPIAGGTDLMVAITGEIGEPPASMRRPVGLDALARHRHRWWRPVVGALTTYTEHPSFRLCHEHVPALAEAAATIGAAQIQNRGTLGGQHRERLAGRGHAAGPAGSRRRVRARIDPWRTRGPRPPSSGPGIDRPRCSPTSWCCASASRSCPAARCASEKSGPVGPSRSARS